MPPIGLRGEVLPLFTSSNRNLEELSQAIDSARLGSNTAYPPSQENLERKGWDGEKGKIRERAEKSWRIFWEEDDSVSMNLSKPGEKCRGSVQWKTIPGSEKIFPPPVSPKDIAQKVMNQAILK